MTFYHYHTVKTRLRFVEQTRGEWYIFVDYSSVDGPADTYLFTDEYFFSKHEAIQYLRDNYGPDCEGYETGTLWGHVVEIADGIDEETEEEEE